MCSSDLTAAQASGVWTTACSGTLELTLQAGVPAPALGTDVMVKKIGAISVRDHEIIALVTLAGTAQGRHAVDAGSRRQPRNAASSYYAGLHSITKRWKSAMHARPDAAPSRRNLLKAVAAAVDLVRAPAPGVTVLIYHRVGGGTDSAVDLPVDEFRRHLDILNDICRVIGLDDAVAALAAGGPTEPAVVLTFDDGTADFTDQIGRAHV